MRRGAFVQNNAGETPLHLAARTSLVSIVQHLIKLGASLTLLDKNGTVNYSQGWKKIGFFSKKIQINDYLKSGFLI